MAKEGGRAAQGGTCLIEGQGGLLLSQYINLGQVIKTLLKRFRCSFALLEGKPNKLAPF